MKSAFGDLYNGKSRRIPSDMPEPLPLFNFDDIPESYKANSFTGDSLPSIEHALPEGEIGTEGGLLYNVFDTLGLSRFLSNSSNIMEISRPLLIYESKYSKDNASNTENHYESATHIQFSSFFESGNLDRAYYVQREYNTAKSFAATLSKVDCEYDLLLRNDINSNGNTQWYYFKISNKICKRFPIRIRFNIINMRKEKSLYRQGKKPTVYSYNSAKDGWCNKGEDIVYYKNNNMYTLSFTLSINAIDDMYIASHYPYTYTNLQNYLNRLEKSDMIRSVMRRKLLCTTLGNNRCELITISAASNKASFHVNKKKPAIVITARIHPGESQSSYAIEGLIDYLTSDVDEVHILLAMFTFKIIPMLNPDGVINGNYRCSLAGCDLNRRYLDGNDELHPTVVAMKEMLFKLHRTRGVSLFIDIHGHSAKKSTFTYGCDYSQEEKRAKSKSPLPQNTSWNRDSDRLFSRLFPKIMSKVSPHFSYRDCQYRVQLSKRGTGRVVAWKNVGITASYTLEISFCGNGSNREADLLHYLNNEALYDGGSFKPKPRGHLSEASFESIAEKTATLRDYFSTARHYSQHDIRRIGRDIGISLFHFANLTPFLDSRDYHDYRCSKRTGNLFESASSYKVFSHLSDETADTTVPELSLTELNKPILVPAVFSEVALKSLSNRRDVSLRPICEMTVRKELKLSGSEILAGLKSESQYCFDNLELICDDESSSDMESMGSDSDPSGDELSLKDLIQQGRLRNLVKPGSYILQVFKNSKRRPATTKHIRATTPKSRPVSSFRRSPQTTVAATDIAPMPSSGTSFKDVDSRKISTKSKLTHNMRKLYEKLNFTRATESSIQRQNSDQSPVYTAEEIAVDSELLESIQFTPEQYAYIKSGTMKPVFTAKKGAKMKSRGIYFPG